MKKKRGVIVSIDANHGSADFERAFPWIFRPARPVVYTQEKEIEMRVKHIDCLSIGAGEFQASEFQAWSIVEFAMLGGS